MSRLTSSSPRRSLNPTGAGRDRGVPGGALRGGTAGSGWMTQLKPLLRLRAGEHVFSYCLTETTREMRKKTFIFLPGKLQKWCLSLVQKVLENNQNN